MHIVGEQIKALRMAQKITQAEFAQRIGVTKSTVSSYENGTRLPSYDVLLRIAGLFRVSSDYLLGYSERLSLDVTGLTPRQLSTLQEIAETYQRYNRLYRETAGAEPED